MEIETMVIGGVILGLLLAIINKKEKTEDNNDNKSNSSTATNLIPDKKVDIHLVEKHLKKIKLSRNEKLKYGYTEKSLQKQIGVYLNNHFVSVQREYGLEGNNAMKIDFNIGRGKVGIEVKLAKSVFKTVGLQRLVGQLKDYSESKYNNSNLIVAVIGEENYLNDRVQLEKLQKRIIDENAHFLYLVI